MTILRVAFLVIAMLSVLLCITAWFSHTERVAAQQAAVERSKNETVRTQMFIEALRVKRNEN